MEDTTSLIVQTPSFDILHYLKIIVSYFISFLPDVFNLAGHLIGILVGLSIVVSAVLLIGIFYSVERLKYIRRVEDKIYNAKVDMGYEEIEKTNPEFKNRWNVVVKHIESDNENDWRQAIMEADILLANLLTRLGYKGEGIGEQLKRAEKADFKTLDQAWEAHKIRNMIAHEGSSYRLSRHESKRIIGLYNQVFKEFYDL